MMDIQPHLDRLATAPADPTALAAVEGAYAGQGRWEELLRVYEDNAARATRPAAAPLLRKAAVVCMRELASGPRAEAYLRQALDAEPNDREALRSLRDLYMARGEYEHALETQERELGRITDPKEKARGLVEMAELCKDQLGRADKAMSALKQAERADPQNADIFRLIAAIYDVQGRLEQAQDALMKELAVAGPRPDLLARLGTLAQRMLERPKLHNHARKLTETVLLAQPNEPRAMYVRSELDGYSLSWQTRAAEMAQRATHLEGRDKEAAASTWLTVAEIQLVYGQLTDLALASVDRALAARPGHASALRLLEEVYGAADRFDELSLKLEMMAAYTREPQVAVELYLKAAMHHAVRLDNAEAAARIYLRVLQLDPGNKVASNALAEFHRERKQWSDALSVLSQWAERATLAADKVAAHYACCRIFEEELNDIARARPHYEAILALDPHNQAAGRALESVYRQARDFAALGRTLRAKLAASQGAERIATLNELGDLYSGPLNDATLAVDMLGELYREKPEAALRERLEQLAARAGAFAALVKILEGGLDKIPSALDKIQALHSLAAIYEGVREAPLEALRMHRRILALDATDERAKQAVERLFEAAAASGDKVAIFEEQAQAAASEAERVKILHRLAGELVTTLKDYVRASDVYLRILKIAPADAVVVDALLGLYRRDNRWAEVADMLAHKSERLPEGAARVPLLVELGLILETKLNQPESAVDRFCLALELAPDSAEAITGLERLLGKTTRSRMVAEKLEPRYLAHKRFDRLAQMLEIRVSTASEPEARAQLLLRVAETYETHLKRPTEAMQALLRAFQADPASPAVQAQLERLAQAVGDSKSLIRAYRAAGRVLEGEARVRVMTRSGALAARDGDVGGALADYLRLVGIDEATDAVALDAVAKMCKAGPQAVRLHDICVQVAEGLDEAQLGRYWRTLAKFNETVMNSPSDAVLAWKCVLTQQPADSEAIKELDRMLDSSPDAAGLADHLRGKLQTAPDDNERAATALRLATVLADRLNDVQGAVQALTEVAQRSPGQRAIWQRLGDLYARANMPQQAAEVLHREINLLADGPDRRERLVLFANIAARQLNDVQSALGALQGVVTAEPAHAGALALLVDLYGATVDAAARTTIANFLLPGLRAAGRWQDVVGLQSTRLDGLPDAERLVVVREMAAIKAEQLKDPAGAFADLEGAFRSQPLDAELRRELEQLANKANLLPQLIDAYSAALGVITDADSQRPIRRKLAEALDRVGRGAEAVEHYKAAGGGSLPEDMPSLEALERLLRTQNRPHELADVLGVMVARLPADARDKKRALLTDLAALCEQTLADKQRALVSYRSLVELDPKDVKALRGLERMLADVGEPQELAQVLDRIIELAAAAPEVVDDYLKRAQVSVELGQFDDAFKAFRAVLLKKREHPGAVSGLEMLIERAPNKVDIAQVLEPLYTAKQDHAKLAWVLERRLDGVTDLTQRKSLLRRIGDIYENRLQQKDRAFAMARRSLGEDPADMGVRMWIEKLAGETNALRDLADAYAEEAKKAEPKLGLQFHRRAAAILHEKLNDVAGAVGAYEAILGIDPKDEKALAGLEAIFRASDASAELVGVLQRRIALTAGVERKREYLTEIAKLQAEKLGDFAGAFETQKQILVLTPDDPAAFEFGERLLAQQANWEGLAAYYDAEIKRLTEKHSKEWVARRLELSYRRGRVADEQFGEPKAASEIFAAIFAENPEHASTLAYLQARAVAGSAPAVTLLETSYKSRKLWQQYIELLQLKLSQTAELADRRAIYVEVSVIFDVELKAGDMAFMALGGAFNENRTDRELLAELEKIAGKYSMWRELVAALAVDIDAVPDQKLRLHILHRLGDICGNQLNDPQNAIAYLQHCLQFEPTDDVALSTLDGLLEKNQMWAALADILERRMELATEPSAKSKVLERLAFVWGDKLMDAEAALRCHKQILEIDPDHPLTLKSMQKLYAEVQDWDALEKNLARQADVLKDKDDQVRIHTAAGQLYGEELTDNGKAIEHWLKVVALEPAHQIANPALDVLLSAEERWQELADHYRRQLTFTKDPQQKSEINRRLGVILGDKLGQSEDALSSWQEVLTHDPKNVDALRALLGLYNERAMWEEFVGIARRLVPLVDPTEAKETRLGLARALGEHLGKRDDAIKLAREVRATEPHTVDVLSRLATVLINIEAYDEAVIALEKAGALETEVDAKLARYYQAVDLYRDKLQKPNDARVALEAIFETKPDEARGFELLAEVYRNTQDWRKLVVLAESYTPHAPPDKRIAVLTEIRDVQDQKLGEKEVAFIAGVRVYKENPSDLNAAAVLERLGIETGGAEELVAMLEDEVERIVDTDVKIASYKRIARVYAEHVKDVAQAEATFEKILAIAPGESEALDGLAGLGAGQDRFDKQVQALERKLSQVNEDQAKKSILAELARIWEDRIGDIDQAIAALQRVLEIDGADLAALNELVRIFQKESRFGELAHTLTRKVELVQDPAESIELRMRVGALCEGELADAEAAIQWYRGVLDFDAANQGALSALERLYTMHDRWSELVQVFEVQFTHAGSAEDKISLLAKTASIYENQFDSQKDAAACYERVLEVDSTHLPSLKNLERLLRGLGEWNRLIEILQHHITLVTDPNEVTELHLEIGEIFYKELSRVDKAEQVYTAAKQLNPQSTAALHALGQLYERSGNWFQSLEMLIAEADLHGADAAGLPVLMRIGRINEEMLMDIDAAKGAYMRALGIDATYPPALAALKEIAKGREDWDAYAEHLTTEAETTQDAEQKTDLLIEAARFFQNVRSDEESAKRYYLRALETTPGHFDAARALAEIYFRAEAWKEAGDLYMVVLNGLDKAKDAKEFCQKSHRLGYINEKLGNSDDALEFYKQAFEADATYLPALEGLGQALLHKEAWDEALKVFQSILIHHRDSLTESEVVDVQWQLGDICQRQNQPDRAYKQFEKALEIDPDHGPSLRALASLDLAMENWDGAYARLSRVAEVAPGPERVEVLVEMSEIAADKLNDSTRAVDALEKARKLGQPRLDLFERMATGYQRAAQPAKAAEVLEQALPLSVDNKDKLSELNLRLGALYETELKHEPLAVQRYNAALDAAPTNIKAFEAVERILASRQEWAILEANYRAMIGRSKDLSPAVRLVLWRNLGELYRRVLKNVDGAIMAYEVIAKLVPGKREDQAILAELYAQKPDTRKKAITMAHQVLGTADNPVGPIRNLRKLYHAERDFDAVYVLCSALTFLKEADEEEKKVFDYLAQGVPPKATQGLSEDSWKLVAHEELYGPVGTLAAWLYRSAPDFVTVPAKDLNLKKKDQIDVRQSELYFANLARYVAKVLNIQVFDAYRRAGSMEPLHLVNSQPPALVAGENNDIFRDSSQRVVIFHVGRNLAYARPEMFLAGIFPPDQLRDVLLGLCMVFNRSLQHTSDPREVERWASTFEKLPPQTLKRLQGPASAAYGEIVKGKPFEAFGRAVEITAARAGFLVAGELAAAVRGITEGAAGASTLPVRDRVKELVLYSVSRPYLDVRKLLGAALVEGKSGAS